MGRLRPRTTCGVSAVSRRLLPRRVDGRDKPGHDGYGRPTVLRGYDVSLRGGCGHGGELGAEDGENNTDFDFQKEMSARFVLTHRRGEIISNLRACHQNSHESRKSLPLIFNESAQQFLG